MNKVNYHTIKDILELCIIFVSIIAKIRIHSLWCILLIITETLYLTSVFIIPILLVEVN